MLQIVFNLLAFALIIGFSVTGFIYSDTFLDLLSLSHRGNGEEYLCFLAGLLIGSFFAAPLLSAAKLISIHEELVRIKDYLYSKESNHGEEEKKTRPYREKEIVVIKK